jgi:hypothetical protein
MSILGNTSQVWWHIAVISAFKGQEEDNCEFEASLGYIVSLSFRARPYLKKPK